MIADSLLRFAKHILAAHGGLGGVQIVACAVKWADPIDIPPDRRVEGYVRAPAQRAESGDVADRWPRVSDPELPRHDRLQSAASHAQDQAGEIQNSGGPARTDVEDAVVGCGIFHQQQVGPRYIA